MNEFIDNRDGNKYKIIKIGGLLWFAENLRYLGVPHRYPNRNSDNVPEYGCLYTWDNAMEACPKDWRLPTLEEFKQLVKETKYVYLARKYKALRSRNWGGTDELGFNAMPAGYAAVLNEYTYFGRDTRWWSSAEEDNLSAYCMMLHIDRVTYANLNKRVYFFSARCVKNI